MRAKQIARYAKRSVNSRIRMKRINTLLSNGLPWQMKSALEYLATGRCDDRTKAVASVVEALVDEDLGDGRLRTRTERQAPQIDGCTFVSNAGAAPGEFLTVEIVNSDTYDLHAVPVTENAT